MFRDFGKVHHGSIYSIRISKKLNLLLFGNNVGQVKQLDLDDVQTKQSNPVIKDNGKIVRSGI